MSLTLLSAKAAAAAGGGPVYSDDVFASTLYTGNGAARSIVTGVDLLTDGGLEWLKARNAGSDHMLFDTVRAARNFLRTNRDFATFSAGASTLDAFTTAGFNLGADGESWRVNVAADSMVGWAFRQAAKFFKIVAWTGDGSGGRSIPHSLGVAPGLLTAKAVTQTGYWWTQHRSGTTGDAYLSMNTTDGIRNDGGGSVWNNAQATASQFSVGSLLNSTGVQYIAYLWAHDASADGVIQCGITDGTTPVVLGWQPQYLLLKAPVVSNWVIVDTARGFTAANDAYLIAEGTGAEASFDVATPSSTGFTPSSSLTGSSNTWLYMAIRAPNKPPDLSTYAKFAAWVNAQSVTFDITGGGVLNSAGTYRAVNTGSSANSIGSPHGYVFNGPNSATNRIWQHAYPSQAAFVAGDGQRVMAVLSNAGSLVTFNSVTRNGYTSLAWDTGDAYGVTYMDTFVYWDNALGKAMKRSPRYGDTGTGIPSEFTGTF